MTSHRKWQFVFNEAAEKQFSKLDKPIQKQIVQGIEKILNNPNPKLLASQLRGHKRQFWRYRIGDYRIIVHFEDRALVIVAVKIGHRRSVYD
jgi:mRNA interferase RelE/StbE